MRFLPAACTLLCLSLFLGAGPAHAEPFAPTPKIPKGYDDPLYVKILEKMKKEMPDAKKMPAPLCPGCVALQMWAGMEGSFGSVQLLSPQPAEKVVAFYRKQLADWNHSKDYDFEWVFWKGEETKKNTRMPTVPHVVIYVANPKILDKKLFGQMKTQITIFFDPNPAKPTPKAKPTDAP